jgi:TldD protein
MRKAGPSRREVLTAGAGTAALLGAHALFGPKAWAAPAAGGIGYFAQFGVDARMIKATLTAAMSRGGDRADVFFQHRVTNYLSLEDGAINRADAEVLLGVGVRVVQGDQTGYGYTEELTPESLRSTALTAATIASGPARKGPTRLRVGRRPEYYKAQIAWEEVGAQKKLPILNKVNAEVFAGDPRIQKVNVWFEDGSEAMLVVDSDGNMIEDLRPMTSIAVSCAAEHKRRREQNGYNLSSRAGLEFYTPERLQRLVKQAVERTTLLFDAVQPEAGEMPVVLAAGSSGILLHEAIGHGMEADFNRKGISIYADRVGKPIAKPFVNIVDDATNIGSRGALDVDDEGTPAGRTVLVDKGILATYLHDRISAKHYKVPATGSGRRESYQFAPMPRMRTTYMLPGPHKKEEIVASVKKGIYCSNFTNGQVQIGAGDFTFYVKNGWLIEDGRLTRPIKDVNIIGNGPKVLEQVDMVADDMALDEGGWTCGKDGQSVPVSLGLPTLRVASITVGGRSKQS